MVAPDKITLACPSCATLNRLPADRLEDGGRCGQCREPLFQRHPVELTRANFEKHAAASDIPLLVDFWAAWCGPCRQMAPGFEASAATLEPYLRLGKLDTEAETNLAARFRIQSIPTLILFHKGEEIARTSGALPPAAILQWVEQAKAANPRHFQQPA